MWLKRTVIAVISAILVSSVALAGLFGNNDKTESSGNNDKASAGKIADVKNASSKGRAGNAKAENSQSRDLENAQMELQKAQTELQKARTELQKEQKDNSALSVKYKEATAKLEGRESEYKKLSDEKDVLAQKITEGENETARLKKDLLAANSKSPDREMQEKLKGLERQLEEANKTISIKNTEALELSRTAQEQIGKIEKKYRELSEESRVAQDRGDKSQVGKVGLAQDEDLRKREEQFEKKQTEFEKKQAEFVNEVVASGFGSRSRPWTELRFVLVLMVVLALFVFLFWRVRAHVSGAREWADRFMEGMNSCLGHMNSSLAKYLAESKSVVAAGEEGTTKRFSQLCGRIENLESNVMSLSRAGTMEGHAFGAGGDGDLQKVERLLQDFNVASDRGVVDAVETILLRLGSANEELQIRRSSGEDLTEQVNKLNSDLQNMVSEKDMADAEVQKLNAALRLRDQEISEKVRECEGVAAERDSLLGEKQGIERRIENEWRAKVEAANDAGRVELEEIRSNFEALVPFSVLELFCSPPMDLLENSKVPEEREKFRAVFLYLDLMESTESSFVKAFQAFDATLLKLKEHSDFLVIRTNVERAINRKFEPSGFHVTWALKGDVFDPALHVAIGEPSTCVTFAERALITRNGACVAKASVVCLI